MAVYGTGVYGTATYGPDAALDFAGFYAVRVVPLGGGAPVATFEEAGRATATVENVTWVLNQPGSMTFSAPLLAVATAQVTLLTREVQVFRDAVLIWQGIPIQRSRSGGSMRFTCAGLLWPFTHWHVGPNVADYLNGVGLFEGATPFASWTTVGATVASTTSLIREGEKAALLTSAAQGADNYIQTTFVVADTGGVGLYLELTGEYHIDTSTAWVGPAFEERGLYIASPNSAQVTEWEPITNSSSQGTWNRVTTGINFPPSLLSQTVTVRLYSPGGRIAWDNVVVKAEFSISSQPTGTDAATLLGQVIDYCEVTKTDLNLTRSNPATGVLITDVYRYDELPNIMDIFESYPERNLLDFGITTGRVFTSYAPRKGSLVALPLTVTPDTVPPVVTVQDYGYQADGAQTKSRVIRTGDGSGATRDVYQVTDTSLTGGLVLESVESVPAIYGPNGVRDTAAVDLARLRDVVTVPSARVPADGYLGVLTEGDTVVVTITDGAVVESSTRRVRVVNLDPGTDTIQYEVEAEAVPV